MECISGGECYEDKYCQCAGCKKFEKERLYKIVGKAKSIEFNRCLNALAELFGGSSGMSNDEIREELREEGFDIDGAEKRLLKFQRKISAIAKIDLN